MADNDTGNTEQENKLSVLATLRNSVEQLSILVKAWSGKVVEVETDLGKKGTELQVSIQELQDQLNTDLQKTKTELEGSIGKVQKQFNDEFGSIDSTSKIELPDFPDNYSLMNADSASGF